MNRKVTILILGAIAIGAGLGWIAHRESAPPQFASQEAVERTAVASAEPIDDFPLHGEEEGELDDLLVEGEAVPEPAPARGSRMSRPLAEAWAELGPRAEQGDARAAMQLFVSLDRCRRVLRPSDRERRQRERMEASAPPEWRDRVRERMQAMERHCMGADPGWLDTGLDWLTQAADGGEVAAKLMWASRADAYLDLANADESTQTWHRQMARRYLDEAVAAGSTQAMAMVARRDVEADAVNALAHAALASRIADERLRAALARPDAGTDPRRQRHVLQQQLHLQWLLDRAGARLGDAQVATAYRRADELYERCCR